MEKYVGYVRVSTKSQGASGLGEAAQRDMLTYFVSARSGHLVEVHREIESGCDSLRPVLMQAIKRAKEEGAVLLIARLDRLSRNVAFVSRIMEQGVRFTACDMPEANEFTVHVMAAMAQQEARAVSVRTKAALAQAKKRGIVLGNPRLSENREKAAARRRETALEALQPAIEYLSKVAAVKGALQVREAVDLLRASGIPAPRKGQWHVSTAWRAMDCGGLLKSRGKGNAERV